MRDKVTRQCPQTTTFLRGKESQSSVEPRSFHLPAYRLTARPNRLTIRCCVARWSLVLHCNPVTAAGMGLTPLLPKPPSHTKPPPPPPHSAPFSPSLRPDERPLQFFRVKSACADSSMPASPSPPQPSV